MSSVDKNQTVAQAAECVPAPATQQAGESVYAFRRKGLEDFCTCDEARYEELSNKPHLFETRVFYTAPQPPQHQPPIKRGATGECLTCSDHGAVGNSGFGYKTAADFLSGKPVAWAATSEDGDVEALGMNQSRRFDTPLYTHPSPPEGMAGWMPIETAPKDKTNVILLRQACGSVANGFWLAEAYAGNGSWIWPYVHKNPTHWIPAPPIASEAKGAGHA